MSYWQLLLWSESWSWLLHCSFNETKLISVTCILSCVLPPKLHDITWFCQDWQAVRWQRLAMRLSPISLPLKPSSGEPKIPFSLLGSCSSQPQWLKADGWKNIDQSWKAASRSWNSSCGTNNLHFVMFHAVFFLFSRGESAQFYTHQTFSWPVSCARQTHHPSVIRFLTTSAATISRLAGTKLCILTVCWWVPLKTNGFTTMSPTWCSCSDAAPAKAL